VREEPSTSPRRDQEGRNRHRLNGAVQSRRRRFGRMDRGTLPAQAHVATPSAEEGSETFEVILGALSGWCLLRMSPSADEPPCIRRGRRPLLVAEEETDG
jgi:hypothetical protein